MNDVKQAFNVSTRQEATRLYLARLIEDKIKEAFRLMQTAHQAGKIPDFVECFQKTWPQNDGRPWRQKPRFTLRSPDGDYTLLFENLSNEYDAHSRTIRIAISPLRQANSDEHRELALANILDAVYHEIQHLHIPGADLQDDDPQSLIDYLGHPGEIEAHASQFARRFAQEYPGESFTLEKMRQLAEKQKQEGRNQAYNYFITFAQPEKQAQYKPYGNLAQIHQSILTATTHHHSQQQTYRNDSLQSLAKKIGFSL